LVDLTDGEGISCALSEAEGEGIGCGPSEAEVVGEAAPVGTAESSVEQAAKPNTATTAITALEIVRT
jgi:hypothetical protein